ncbi:TlpA family protein disulfide reductase [Variovorax boronicumulans]|uniref:Thiol-disulfide isomerase/thioredoxin n=1 Tax=Variovorax boronicumulans TaxID=436515 RepID=A0AAW8DRR4_9BURK|nr:TlpA disulfide reductase family protein [Variovorax boronicumulans]MDP9877191.1 thiol-disulfide isomerase/thioredoxin [Variovorax boronicumulans]MDP9921932.1 thiol-disulfide isomerase/thioredoxin [Variovorax boronicumulans]PBI91292.1 Thiol-disulfide oxidoreductase ResA [Variovorax boronicumulans]GER13113.1 TlpA family protein disulfide reductase [Variovorax boronicumulans]
MTSTPTRRGMLYAGVAAVAAAAGIAGAWWRERNDSGVAATGGEKLDAAMFWDQRFERPEGGELVLSSLRGKPVLLNFWATWCPPCVEEMPMIDAFFREHGANGWQVVGLAIDQPSAVRKFLQRTPVTYPTALAGLQGMELVKNLGNTGGGLPFTLVLHADGSVLARKMGKLETTDLDAWRRQLVHG